MRVCPAPHRGKLRDQCFPFLVRAEAEIGETERRGQHGQPPRKAAHVGLGRKGTFLQRADPDPHHRPVQRRQAEGPAGTRRKGRQQRLRDLHDQVMAAITRGEGQNTLVQHITAAIWKTLHISCRDQHVQHPDHSGLRQTGGTRQLLHRTDRAVVQVLQNRKTTQQHLTRRPLCTSVSDNISLPVGHIRHLNSTE